MKRKITVLTLCALLFELSGPAEAQQPKKLSRIGLLAFGTSEADRQRQQPFLQGLRDLGWIEGQNIAIERRYANESYDQLPAIAAELVRLRVTLLLCATQWQSTLRRKQPRQFPSSWRLAEIPLHLA